MKYNINSVNNNSPKIFQISKVLNRNYRILNKRKYLIENKQLGGDQGYKESKVSKAINDTPIILNKQINYNDNNNNLNFSINSNCIPESYLTNSDSANKTEESITCEINEIPEKDLIEKQISSNSIVLVPIKTEDCIYIQTKTGTQKLGKWTKEEDNLLLREFEIHGNNWANIAKEFKTRSSKQIRSRFLNHLNYNLDKSKFKDEEDKLIISLYPFLKNKWTRYLNYFPRRSARAIESRLFSLLKKEIFINHNNNNQE